MNIQNNARKRELVFDLTEEVVGDITDDPCFYCGEETTPDKRNGLDRLNNAVGYIKTNVVSCCGTCNNMKKCLDPTTFVERCAQVAYHYGHEGRITDRWTIVEGCTYAQYKARTKRDLEITVYQCIRLRKGDCTYCGRGSVGGHMNGIDRVDNDLGYVDGNCVTCCGDCNVAKGTSTAEDFIAKCIAIASRSREIPEGIPRQLKMIQRRGKY